MSSIVFEALAPPVPEPPAVGDAALRIAGTGFAAGVQEGALGDAELIIVQGAGGTPPQPIAFGIGDGSVLLSGFGFGAGVEPPAHGDADLVLKGRGSHSAEVGDADLVIVGAGNELKPPPTDGDDARRLTAGVVLGAIQRSMLTLRLEAALSLRGSARVRWQGAAQLRAAVTFEEQLSLILSGVLQAQVELGASVTAQQTAVAQMVDVLVLSGAVNSDLEARQLLADALAFGDVLEAAQSGRLEASVGVGAAVREALDARARLVDELLLGAAGASAVTLVAVLKDSISFEDGILEQLEARAVLRDSLHFMMRLQLEDGEYVAWVMDTRSKAQWRYTNYPFNSFMRVGGVDIGATDTGLYVLDGDDDAGEPIHWKLRAGLSTMGSRALKRYPAVYLGYAATGDVLLRVVVANAEDSIREAHTYRLRARAAESMREGRVPIGKGLKSVYWDWIMEDVDGGEIELDTVEFLPMQLERRVRGNSGGKR